MFSKLTIALLLSGSGLYLGAKSSEIKGAFLSSTPFEITEVLGPFGVVAGAIYIIVWFAGREKRREQEGKDREKLLTDKLIENMTESNAKRVESKERQITTLIEAHAKQIASKDKEIDRLQALVIQAQDNMIKRLNEVA